MEELNDKELASVFGGIKVIAIYKDGKIIFVYE
ncbi:MAG: bacteriocin [Parabacteroides sp.]|nr:bacteriocin [Parabacteroides sp.]